MKFVVIGASAAGINAVQKLRKLNPDDERNLFPLHPVPLFRMLPHIGRIEFRRI